MGHKLLKEERGVWALGEKGLILDANRREEVLEGVYEVFLIALIKTAMLLTFKLPMLPSD